VDICSFPGEIKDGELYWRGSSDMKCGLAAMVNHQKLIEQLKTKLGTEVTIETLVDLPAVSNNENNPLIKMVYSVFGINKSMEGFPKSLSYLTDGSVLQSANRGVPTIILGPGQPEMAHHTDEYCHTEKLENAVEIYKNIMLKG